MPSTRHISKPRTKRTLLVLLLLLIFSVALALAVPTVKALATESGGTLLGILVIDSREGQGNVNTGETKLSIRVTSSAVYKLTLEKGNTEPSEVVDVPYYQLPPTVTKPKRTGYLFQGYYDISNTQYYDANGVGVHIWDKSSNGTLYAHWALRIECAFPSEALIQVDAAGKVTGDDLQFSSSTVEAIKITAVESMRDAGASSFFANDTTLNDARILLTPPSATGSRVEAPLTVDKTSTSADWTIEKDSELAVSFGLSLPDGAQINYLADRQVPIASLSYVAVPLSTTSVSGGGVQSISEDGEPFVQRSAEQAPMNGAGEVAFDQYDEAGEAVDEDVPSDEDGISLMATGDTFVEGPLTYQVINEDAKVVGVLKCDTAASGSLSIPASVRGYKVYSLEVGAFINCSLLTSVDIPNSVVAIYPRTFENCTSLTSVIIPDSVITIMSGAFSDCSSLTSITIPDSVQNIYAPTFNGCSSLVSIDVNSSNKYFSSQEGVLYNKNKTQLLRYPQGKSDVSFTVPNSVTTLGSNVFYGCSQLTSITIPASVKTIEINAFRECSSLHSLTIPDSVTTLGENAFSRCSSLASLTIPDSVTTLGDSIFWGCSQLVSIVISDSVKTIGKNAFYQCFSLTTVTIPDSVTSIGTGIFGGCYKLASVTIGKGISSLPSGFVSTPNSKTFKDIYVKGDITSIDVNAFSSITISEVRVHLPANADRKVWTDRGFSASNLITSYEVSFDAQGGSPASTWQLVDQGSTATQPSNPTRTGYTFDGWYTEATGGTQWNFATQITSNRILYAHWIENTTTVTFNFDGGSSDTASVLATYGSDLPKVPKPTKTGYLFAGYFDQDNTQYYDQEGDGTISWDKDVASVTLSAHWILCLEYTVPTSAHIEVDASGAITGNELQFSSSTVEDIKVTAVSSTQDASAAALFANNTVPTGVDILLTPKANGSSVQIPLTATDEAIPGNGWTIVAGSESKPTKFAVAYSLKLPPGAQLNYFPNSPVTIANLTYVIKPANVV